MLDYSKIIIGEPVRCVVRVKPPTNFQREDVRVMGNTLTITDANNRSFFKLKLFLVIEEFDVP